MKVYTVYILHCSDGTYYTGVTNNIESRVYQHNKGTNPDSYTYKRRPVQLAFYHHFDDPVQAIEFEKKVKGWRREKKEALINDEWEKLPELSKNHSDKGKG